MNYAESQGPPGKNNKIVIEFLLKYNFAQMEWKQGIFAVCVCTSVITCFCVEHIFTLSLRHCFVPPDNFSDISFSRHILNIIIVFSSYKGILSTVYTDAEGRTMPSTLSRQAVWLLSYTPLETQLVKFQLSCLKQRKKSFLHESEETPTCN